VLTSEGAVVGNTSSVVDSPRTEDEAWDCVEASDTTIVVVVVERTEVEDSTALEEAAVDASE
jgi:hypothetical protein